MMMDRPLLGYMSECKNCFGLLLLIVVTRHTRPMDFDYKQDAKHISTFVVAELWQDTTDESALTKLAYLTSSIKACERS